MARSFSDSDSARCNTIAGLRAARRQPVKKRSSRMNLPYLSDNPELAHSGNNDLTHQNSIICTVFDGLKQTIAIITTVTPV